MPRKKAKAKTKIKSKAKAKSKAPKKEKEIVILVVEDELPLQKAVRAKLEKYGFQVVTASSIDQALNHMKDIRCINIVWLDHYLLGQGEGLDFVAKMKKSKKWSKIPIFVVSNTASADKVKSYLALGIKKYYVKADYRLDEIIKDIKKYLKNPQ